MSICLLSAANGGSEQVCADAAVPFFRPSVIAARKSLRVNGRFRKPRSLEKRGRRDAERRTLVTAAACFPDCRETEAHGNASQRPVAAIFQPRPALRRHRRQANGPPITTDFPPSPAPRPAISWQAPVVGPGGIPRPPECKELRLLLPAGAAPTPRLKASLRNAPQ